MAHPHETYREWITRQVVTRNGDPRDDIERKIYMMGPDPLFNEEDLSKCNDENLVLLLLRAYREIDINAADEHFNELEKNVRCLEQMSHKLRSILETIKNNRIKEY